MLFLSLLSSVDALGLRTDYPFGPQYRHNTTHLDIFMAIFMVCTFEIVILKIMVSDDTTLPEEHELNGSQSSDRQSVHS